MCQFKSVIVLRNGDILHDNYTDSHEDLINFYGLSDNGEPSLNRFVRVEYTPKDVKDYDKPSKYVMKVDESETPAWFEEVRESVQDKLDSLIKRMIIKDDKKKCLLSGCYILTGKAKLQYIRNTRIVAMYDSAQIKYVYDSAQIKYVCDSAQIESVYGSAQIKYVCDSAQIKYVCDSAQIKYVCDSAQIEYVCGSAQIEYVCDSAQIKSVYGSAQIEYVCDSAQIEYVCGSAQLLEVSMKAEIKSITDKAKIVKDNRIAVS